MPDETSPPLPGQHTEPFTANLILTLLSAFAAAGAANAGGIALEEQQSLSFSRPTLLSAAEMSEAIRRGGYDPQQMKRTLERAGYTDIGIAALMSTIPALLDPNSIQALLNRRVIEETEARELLAKLGYDGNAIDSIIALRIYVPSAQDVVTFANRDVYYPDVVTLYQMDGDFPVAMLPDMARAGMDEETAHKFWQAHWSVPSLQQAYEMLQRDAETGITAADVNRLQRAAGMEPYWRDKLTAIAYNPFTRVDIRRMNKAGILNRAEVVRAYRDIGYAADRAEKLTQFTEKLNGSQAREEIQPFVASFKTHAESLFIDGLLDQAGFETLFTDLGVPIDEAHAYVAEAQFIKHASDRKVIREAIRHAYEGGHITAEDAQARLSGDGYTATEVSALMATWHIVRELHDLSAHQSAQRELSKSEVLTAYVEGIITVKDAKTHLRTLRYDDADVDLEIALADARQAKADRTAAEHVQHALYIARKANGDAVTAALGKLNVPVARITALLAEWEMELTARAPTLTRALVAAAVAQGFIKPEDGAQRLAAMGYDRADVEIIILLASKGVIDVQ